MGLNTSNYILKVKKVNINFLSLNQPTLVHNNYLSILMRNGDFGRFLHSTIV